MQTNCPIISDANLVNSINTRAYSLSNQGLIIDRGIMISNYTQETIDSCWLALSTNILQNYQKGKGTYIKNLGTFTFKSESINLEGTTNQYSRDKKPKLPVFIVSKEYIRDLSAGEYTKQNGIRYYIQKENKDISIVKLNFAQIAYSISMSKDEAMNLINNLILYLMESIAQKTFKNKLLPGVGVLLTRGNIVAVKFDNNLIEENKYKNYMNTFTKKNISMDMDMSKAQEAISQDCVTPYKNIEALKAKNSLMTRMDNTAKNFLKKNFKTDVMNFPQHEIKDIYKTIEKNVDCDFNFLNDNNNKSLKNDFYKIKKNISNKNILKTKNDENNNLLLGFLDEDILKDFEYFKGILIKNSEVLEVATQIDTVVFDKTGTLTYGLPTVSKIIIHVEKEEKEILELLASIEKYSNHPLAKGINNYAKKNKIKVNDNLITEDLVGYGVKAKDEDNVYYACNKKLLKKLDISNSYEDEELLLSQEGNTVIYLVRNKKIIALIGLKDTIRKESKRLIENLKERNINVLLLSGDNEVTTMKIANDLNLSKEQVY